MLLSRVVLACALGACVLSAFSPAAGADPLVGVDMQCYAPAGDPAPNSPEWIQRDTVNQYCAGLRIRDQLLSPAYGYGNLTQGATQYFEQWSDQLADPSHPRGGVTTLVPGSKAADAFRTVKRWTEMGRGRVAPVSFTGSNGATLRGHVFAPPAAVKRPGKGFPGVVITDGSVQAYEELYFWAAEDLAEAGYVVMTYDVQGQGDSDLAGDDCPGACSGVPYQQDFNFYQGAEDSLSFFLSTANPLASDVNRARIGLAGHSLGAAAVSHVGQCDKRVKTIVAWDNLGKITDCGDVTIPAQFKSAKLLHAPALGLTNDYGFWTQPQLSAPDPHSKDAGYQQVAAAGLDAASIAFRGATHLTYSFIPLVFQANELSERMASYYTTAWFDAYLKGKRRSGFRRLTAKAFDGSADKHSIGTGTYDQAAAAADPTNRYAGNVPYRIAGIKTADAVSFYYLSQYSLTDPKTKQRVVCPDLRHDCKAAPGR
jgi:alpha-beta hydrolase superfamily lysophospholipase